MGPADQTGSIGELVRDILAGRVETLLILGGNPAYDAPADLDFVRVLASERTKLRIHLGQYDDETARLCHWHIPQAHSLETWSDLRAFDGTVTIQQPLIAPLYEGRSAHELLALLLGQPDLSGLEIVRDYWKRQGLAGDFEGKWREALEAGLIKGTTAKPKSVGAAKRPPKSASDSDAGTGSLEIVFRPDPTIWDGRYANNGWLQELPKPLAKFSWGSAALLSPATGRGSVWQMKMWSSLALAAARRKCRPGSCRGRPINRSLSFWGMGVAGQGGSGRAWVSTRLRCALQTRSGSAAASKSRRRGNAGRWPRCIITSTWKEGI